MLESSPNKAEAPAPNLGDVIADALHQAKTLVQAELSLVKRELTHEVTSALSSLVWIVVGVLFAQAALTTLGVLAVLALGAGVASVGVVVLLAAIAATFFVIGMRALKQRKLPRSTARLASDAKRVMETVK